MRLASFHIGRFVCLAVLLALAACGSHTTRHARTHYDPTRYYPPPGPTSDPWGPYIKEASGRFNVPETWVRRVMRQESGGQQDVVSWVGAMGLMQVMPDTYDELRGRYALGDDPFDPHNNILAGTAYLREMYDRYGSPGFLAAYNAGPNRLERYLNNGTPLPMETVNYVANIAPQLGPQIPTSGPLAVYAVARRPANGCDPDAAYDPDRTCGAAPRVTVASYTAGPCDPDAAYDPARHCSAAPRATVATYTTGPCDPDAAYDPNRHCSAPPRVMQASYTPGPCDPDAAYDPSRPCRPEAPGPERTASIASAPSSTFTPQPPMGRNHALQNISVQVAPTPNTPEPGTGGWAIQVGAFATLSIAESATQKARSALPDLLRTAKTVLPATVPFGSQVAFRARLLGLSQSAAADACARLTARGTPCLTVPPGRDTF